MVDPNASHVFVEVLKTCGTNHQPENLHGSTLYWTDKIRSDEMRSDKRGQDIYCKIIHYKTRQGN